MRQINTNKIDETTVISSCSAFYYNFKKGDEYCQNKLNCHFYDKDFYDLSKRKGLAIRHKNIKEFRNCDMHKK